MGEWPVMMAWLCLHAGIGLAGTWLARRYALRRKLMDEPGERRSHTVATPRGGGISVVLAMLVALALLAMLRPESWPVLAFAGSGLVAVATIGWIDDHRPLSPWLRLGIHGMAGGLLGCAVLLAGGTGLEVLLACGAAVVLINVWNFMDGIDGLAASQALLAAIGYALFMGSGAGFWLGLALAAALCGFLPFNLPRARIFMGDVGSGAIGYVLAGLMVLSLMSEPGWGTRLLVTLPLLVFLVDASLTLFSRMLHRERWWEPHVQHAYQHWARRMGRHGPVTSAYATASLLAVMAMLGARSLSTVTTIAMIAGFGLSYTVCWWRFVRKA